jgi:hypothetical protein
VSENARPRGGGGAADDVLAALSQRVRELQSKLGSVQAELAESQRRLAAYEEFDSTLQDALSGALRAAYEIRSRAEDSANQLLEQAREERRVLMKEVQRLREERDSLQEEMATLRRGGIAAVPRPAPAPEPTSAADLKAAASEAVRSVFDQIVQEMRGRPAPEPAQAQQAAPPLAPIPQPKVEPPPAAPEKPMAPAARAETVAPAARAETVAPQPPMAQPRPEVRPVEPIFVTPDSAPTVQPVPRAVAPGPGQRQAAQTEGSGPSTELQLVLSPVPSFPRLVEIERRIQSLPGVRTLYVRDFRNGVATLAVGLRSAMTADEFADSVRTLDSPRFHLESVARNSVELRIDGEAATA